MKLAENIFLFGRVLRATGVDVHHGRLIDAVRALEWIGIERRDDVAAALRSLLVHRQEDIPRFDEAFEHFFRAHRSPEAGLPLFSLGERPRVVATPASGQAIQVEFEGFQAGAGTASRAIGAWSAAGVSRTKDFGDFTDAELERARRLLARLPWTLSVRRTRRWQPARRGAADLRRLLRRNAFRSGELLELPRRRRREAARPIVVLADVSGSMERYSRMLLHFVYGLSRSDAHVEAFLFATRLTRVTRSTATRRGSDVLSRIARDVSDWGGGTRIGDALRTFNLRWARRVIRNGPILLIVSDGWDRGDPELVEREMARLARSVRRIVWLNPLLGSENYEPLTRGMQAALKHVDEFLPAHNLASLEKLARELTQSRSRVRRQNTEHRTQKARRHEGTKGTKGMGR